MPEKTVPKTKQFTCPKCNRNITFKYDEIQSFADEVEEPVYKGLGKITDYGQCKVAAEASIPNHPTNNEFKACPFSETFVG
jgi:hypothetical protein